MAEKKSKVVGADPKRESRIKYEWAEFSKTTAYQDLMEYMQAHQDTLLKYSEDLAMPAPSGELANITGEMANFLLQRRAGVGIVKTYVRLYTE